MARLAPSVIHNFWFGYTRRELASLTNPNQSQMRLWFASKSEDDEIIKRTFGEHLRETSAMYASTTDYAVENRSFEDVLADIITLDQFSRVIHRKTALAFSNDAHAVELCKAALDCEGFASDAAPLERLFLEMPLMHSENLADHERLLTLRGFDHATVDARAEHSPLDRWGGTPLDDVARAMHAAEEVLQESRWHDVAAYLRSRGAT